MATLTNLHPRSLAALGAVMLGMLSLPAGSAPICRWVDSSGRTQMAEIVPERYKKVATCTDSAKFELSPQQMRAAAQRADEDRARAASAAARSSASAPSGSPRASGEAPRPATKRPAEVVTDATDCPTWWRLYDESTECFGPYRTVGGATKVEAFDVCNVITSPEPKCGPRRR